VTATAFILSALSYFGVQDLECSKSFNCKLVQTIWNWFTVAITLVISGILVILPISLGNSQYLLSWGPIVFAMVLLLIYMLLPFVQLSVIHFLEIPGVDTQFDWDGTNTYLYCLLITYLVAGLLTQIELLRGLLAIACPNVLIRRFGLFKLLFLPSNVRRVARQKRAGTHKINSMIKQAHKLHRKAHKRTNVGSNPDQTTILNFILHGDKKVPCGGFFWTWINTAWNAQLLVREGIWIHSRLCVGQLMQLIGAFILLVIWWFGTEFVADEAEAARGRVSNSVLTEAQLYFIPTRELIYVSFYPGGAIALLMVMLLISVYYPSTVSSILKFRSGKLPSLHDPNFGRYRSIADTIYFNTGNMLYALAGSATLFFILFAGIIFLTFWNPTKDFMLIVIAWGIGLTITVALKMILTMCCKSNYNIALYRKKPLSANLASLALECWFIGLGGGVMLARLTQFLLAAAFWIGRIDSQFLSDDVEVFGYRFDTVPHKYISEILVHEAHRHPYIERLGAMYLMRLKYGEHFCTDAGAMWRNVFVLTLFPWLLKYRQGQDDDDDDDDDFGNVVPTVDDDDKTERTRPRLRMPEPVLPESDPSQRNVRIEGMGQVDSAFAPPDVWQVGSSDRGVFDISES